MFCISLVLILAPAGLTLFYGGLAQRKNVLNTIGMSYVSFLIGLISWIIIGYTLAYSGDNAYIGDLKHFALTNMNHESLHANINEYLFVLY